MLSPSGSGFSPPNEISYRGLKPARVSAALGRSYLRRGADLPQVYPLREDFRRRPGLGGQAYRCSLGTNTVLGLVTKGLLVVPADGGAEN
jgi:hypothetical protein